MLSNDVVLDLDEENGTKNPSVNFRLTLAQLTEVTSFQEALYWSIFLQKKNSLFICQLTEVTSFYVVYQKLLT